MDEARVTLTNFDRTKIPAGERVFLYEDENWRYYVTCCGSQQEPKQQVPDVPTPSSRIDALIAVVKAHDSKLAKAIEQARV